MLIRIWRYRVRPDLAAEFERVYGATGDWVNLFEGAPGFRGTGLFRSTESPREYMTVDRWESEAAFRDFLERAGSAYDDLDRRCDSLTESEEVVAEVVTPD